MERGKIHQNAPECSGSEKAQENDSSANTHVSSIHRELYRDANALYQIWKVKKAQLGFKSYIYQWMSTFYNYMHLSSVRICITYVARWKIVLNIVACHITTLVEFDIFEWLVKHLVKGPLKTQNDETLHGMTFIFTTKKERKLEKCGLIYQMLNYANYVCIGWSSKVNHWTFWIFRTQKTGLFSLRAIILSTSNNFNTLNCTNSLTLK